MTTSRSTARQRGQVSWLPDQRFPSGLPAPRGRDHGVEVDSSVTVAGTASDSHRSSLRRPAEASGRPWQDRPVRHLHVIGIGAGDPDQLSVEAVAVLQSVDAFLVIDKGAATDELVDVRRQIVAAPPARRRVPLGGHRRGGPRPAPRRLRRRGPQLARRAGRAHRGAPCATSSGPDEVGAILVWGDPSLYDSTLRVLDAIAERGAVPFTRSVTAGVTSISALAAAHQIPLHRIGESMLITTGPPPDRARRLAGVDRQRHRHARRRLLVPAPARPPGRRRLEIWWGAYLGMPGQLLVAGPPRRSRRRDRRTPSRGQGRARLDHGPLPAPPPGPCRARPPGWAVARSARRALQRALGARRPGRPGG